MEVNLSTVKIGGADLKSFGFGKVEGLEVYL
jgi:hypothetical protein